MADEEEEVSPTEDADAVPPEEQSEFYDEDAEMPSQWVKEEETDLSTEMESEESEDEATKCYKRKLEREDRWETLSEEEKKHHSKIYIDIIMDIGTQNRILNDLRKKLNLLTKNNPCPTRCEQREIRGLQCCLEREKLRQVCYMKKAQDFLSKAPLGPWDNIPIIASAETEDCQPTMLACTMTDAICKCLLKEKKIEINCDF